MRAGRRSGWPPSVAIAGVLADRNPPWPADFADRMLREQRAQSRWKHWQVVRDLVRRGPIEKPDRPEYTTAMVAGIYAWELGHERLLDACLDAFIRDFPRGHVGWYLELHGQLAPSRDEKAARAGKYLALLSAASKTGVTLGQRECGTLLDAGLLDPRAFLAASAAALLFPQKSAAMAQLKLIGALIKAHPEVRDDALATAAVAFQHEREDVQAAALKLIEKHGVPADEAARAAVESLAAALSPVIAPDAAALGLASAMSSPAALPVPAVRDGAGEPAPSVRDNGFDCVEDPGELVQLLARLIEDASDVLAVERAVAGAVRLASLPLAERTRLAGPLLKRAREQSWGPDAVWLSYG